MSRASVFPGLLVGLLVLAQLSCSSPAVPKAYIAPPKDDKISADTGLETVDPKVDIIFLIDNSGSMYSHQANLSANVNRFVSNFFGKIQVDFHIGVITTDNMDGADCCGKLVGYPPYIEKSTPNYQTVLAQRMMVGTNGAGEEMVFDPLMSALTEPNLSGINKGFLRPDAYLAIVVITDAEDQSEINRPNDLFTFLVNLKGQPSKVLPYGVIVPSGVQNCQRDDYQQPKKIEYFLGLAVTAGSNSFSLCAPDFGDRLSDMGKDLAKRVGNTYYLARIPIVETIEVTYGTQFVAADAIKGWSFDAAKNALVFGPQIEWTNQPPGTKVKVKYDFTQFPDQPKH